VIASADHGQFHHRGVAAMEAAGDIRTGNEREQRLVSADPKRPESFTQITVEIDDFCQSHGAVLLF